MTTDIDSADSTSHGDDILTEIKGLGKTAERDLHSLGIRGFADLAKYTPEELAKKLHKHTTNSRYSVKCIEERDWIGQARRKLAERKKDGSSSPQANTPAMPKTQASGHQLDDWTPQAEFEIRFFEYKAFGQGKGTWQTRVRKLKVHGQEDDKEKPFEGIEPRQWVDWILQEADLPVDVTPNPTQVSILDVQIEPQSPSDVHNSKFMSAIRFTVSGANVLTLTSDNTPYQIIIHAVDSGSGVMQHVASACGQLQTKQAVQIQRLELSIPDLRRYELQTILLIQSQSELMAVYRGPIINVTP